MTGATLKKREEKMNLLPQTLYKETIYPGNHQRPAAKEQWDFKCRKKKFKTITVLPTHRESLIQQSF